jgi:hypothetical protein
MPLAIDSKLLFQGQNSSRLQPLGRMGCNAEAKEMTLVLAILTSMADGTVHKEEANIIRTAARNFGFDKAAFGGIYAQAAGLKKQFPSSCVSIRASLVS